MVMVSIWDCDDGEGGMILIVRVDVYIRIKRWEVGWREKQTRKGKVQALYVWPTLCQLQLLLRTP